MNNKIRKSNYIYQYFCGITAFCTVIYSTNLVSAQITPDNTLPNNSQVKVEGNISTIEGGTTAGTNLFHSFEKFGITKGNEAHFNNAVDISNIITRVTGNSISNIDGLIKANSAANLFLINPNGIVFGENARLDIGGSFVGSTADAVRFGEDNFFSASNPDSSSLLKVNPSALFFNQVKAASIQNKSVADSNGNSSDIPIARGLRVPDGKSLLLVGGDINIDGGGLYAFGGRVELGGLAGKGTVGLNGDGNNLSLSFPEGADRSDVFLSNGAGVAVIADNGGSIAVNARNLEMTEKSFLIAGIESGLGSDRSRAGNIDINVTNAINNNGSFIFNGVLSGASGQAGNININASTLLIEDGAVVSASTNGAGKGGNLTVNAENVQLIGESADTQTASGLVASTQSNSTGDAGDLTVETNTLLVKDGAQVNTSTSGKGKGGNLTVNAENVQLIGESVDTQTASGLFALVQPSSTGDAGDLTVTANTLLVRDGAQVSTSTSGKGKGGNLTVDARDVRLIGTSKDGQFLSGLYAGAESYSSGDAGNLSIKTSNLLIQDGAQGGTDTFGAGKRRNLIQITSNNTLPNNSEVKVEGNTSIIEGGTTAGSNLFHSFEKFGVPKGAQAHFNNAVNISNIITRVTGKTISYIDGLIKANGTASLFFINPNGIVFAENARLDINGSFMGSTADSFKFGDNVEFSATSPGNKLALSNNLPLGLQFGNNPGSIVNKSRVISDNNETIGLQIKPGNSLALIGGDVKLNRGHLTAVEGRIELGSVDGNNLVRLNEINEGWDFKYEGIEEFKDIHMTRKAFIDTSGSGNGEIEIQGKEITLVDESTIWAYTLGNKDGKNVSINAFDLIVKDGSQIAVSSNGEGNGGSLTINASESIKVIGTANNNFPSGLSAQSYGNGSSRDITINTKELVVQDGGQIVTSTYSLDDKLYGKKTAGDLKIFASDSVKLSGTSSSPSAVSSESFGFGNAGDITIKTPQLIIEDGAYISTSSRFFGMGGDLNISSELVKIQQALSGLFTESTFLGNAGSLNIDTKDLLVNNGARISSSFMNNLALSLVNVSPNSKAITYSHIMIPMFLEDNYIVSASINSKVFPAVDCSICDKAFVGTFISTINKLNNDYTEENFLKGFGRQINFEPVFLNNADAGDININASEKIEISGTTPDGKIPSLLFTNTLGRGNAGSLKINTKQLTVRNSAQIAVNSQRIKNTNDLVGDAGSLDITADSIQLQNRARLSANSISTEGNINLQTHNLLLSNDSNITTNARGENVVGGNININTDFLIANENSDISANSENFQGGNIRIDAQGIFGTQSRPQLTPQSDIAATGASQELSGTVEIITPQSDPKNGLVELPTAPVETEVANACSSPGYARSSFTITGKGSLPPSPLKPLPGRLNQTKLATLEGEIEPQATRRRQVKKEQPQIKQIVEAKGWVRTPDGRIILVAHAHQNSNYQTQTNSHNCNQKRAAND
ncbi:MAG: filamentous hemagglutinin N-terminal domain-containing protein [Rivularia sp. (in: Bacteria)]|nr:filamentous hemagglutinin N-terminal domain-containing protein [Rivularia sp. MS3]